jgi:hypothetical protein
MMRALSHIGLSLAVILAPALCCCNLRWMAAASEPTHCPTCPQPAPKPAKPSCCQPACCHEAEQDARTAPAPTPPKAPSPACCCNAERPAAALTVTKPQVPTAEFTGEILALVHASAVTPEHAGLVSGLDPPERAGVDARSAALFDRHVMRC